MSETQNSGAAAAEVRAIPELKKTLTLPETAFPMKANLPQNEPVRLREWAEKADPPGPCAQQVPEGLCRQIKDDGRL